MSDIIRRLKCNQPVKSESGGKKFVVKARQGVVIFVPTGATRDKTRNPGFYEGGMTT